MNHFIAARSVTAAYLALLMAAVAPVAAGAGEVAGSSVHAAATAAVHATAASVHAGAAAISVHAGAAAVNAGAAAERSAVLATRQAAPSAEGHWEGTIQLPGTELGVVVDLARREGAWEGVIDIPAQGAIDQTLTGIEASGDSVRFTISGIPGEPTFAGVLSASGDSLSGDFLQGGQTFPFRLARTGKAEVAGGRPSPQEALEGWDAFVEETMEQWNVPGVAMAIVANGEVVLSKGYGYRDLERELPVTENTVMPIGSASKAFTGLVVGMLVDEGKLSWEEPVRTWLPEFELEDEFASERMTPVDLLTHRSGLPRHDLLWYGSPFSREEIFQNLRYLQPSEEFRTAFQYNNLMYLTAGYLSGRVTDSSWEEQVRTRIFGPLEMTASSMSIDSMRATADDHALGYRAVDAEDAEAAETSGSRGAGVGGSHGSSSRGSRSPDPRATGSRGSGSVGSGTAALPSLRPVVPQDADDDKRIERMEFRPIDAIGPAGSINSNAVDMTRWVELQLGAGTVDGEQIASAPVVQKTHTPHFVVDEGIFAALFSQPEMPYMMYGLGWFVQPYRGKRMIHHGGNIDGFSSLVAFLPDDGLGLVILTNLNGTPAPTVLALSAWDRLLGLEPRDWNARYDDIFQRVEAQQEQVQQGGGIERVEGTSPSHPLDDYAGVYSHPAYGELRIESAADGLEAGYHDFDMALEHFHYDVFDASLAPPFEDLKMKLEFFMNRKGDIDRVSVPLEQSVDPVVFEREPPESMRDLAFLRRFTGEYDFMGMTARVGLREAERTLTVTIPGQPTYRLVPYRGTEFELEGMDGYSVRFEMEDGEVSEMVFIQPTATFRAEKK